MPVDFNIIVFGHSARLQLPIYNDLIARVPHGVQGRPAEIRKNLKHRYIIVESKRDSGSQRPEPLYNERLFLRIDGYVFCDSLCDRFAAL